MLAKTHQKKTSTGGKWLVKEKHYYGKGGKAFPPQLKEVGVSTP